MQCIYTYIRVRVMVFNATFNNISVISWRSVSLLEETGVPWENNRRATSHWQTSSHNVVSSAPHLRRMIMVIGNDCISSNKTCFRSISYAYHMCQVLFEDFLTLFLIVMEINRALRIINSFLMPMQCITPPIYKYIFYKLKANFLCQCFISQSTYHTPTWTDGQADSFIPPNCVLEKVDNVSILKMVWKRTSSKLFNMLNYCLWSSNGPMSLIITRNVGPIRLGHTTTICWMVPHTHLAFIFICQWLATGRWFSPGTMVTSTNKTDRNVIT